MRTNSEIQAEMDAVQATYPALSKLTSTSQLSFFRLLKNMWVLLVMAIEQRVDAATAATLQAITDNQTGSLAWYVKIIKAFQFGDSVTVYDGYRVGYASINPAKQVILQCTVTEQSDGRLLAKVAKASAEFFGPLSEDELTALKEYVRMVKYAGVALDVISLPADELQLRATVKIDRQVLDGNGLSLSSPGTNVVLNAIVEYIRALPFDSVMSWTGLTDALQKVNGVLDFQVTSSATRAAGTSAWSSFTRETTSRAGHMKLIDVAFTYV
ncbi:hypothetical protein [Spirosoma lituiforme]